MFRKVIVPVLLVACAAFLTVPILAESSTREFPVSAGGTLTLDLDTGASVRIAGTGGSSISVSYTMSCTPDCEIQFDEADDGLRIRTRFTTSGGRQRSDIDLEIQVPRQFDVKLDSMGGGVEIDGVDGRFSGKTMGGELNLHDVRGEANLKTMGGEIRLTDSELDGSLKTMGGEVLFENVVGDVRGSSMGGNVRYKNVQRRGGGLASPDRVGGHDDISPDTVQISTMGGAIEVEDAPEGAEVHTMGGKIEIRNAGRFVRAKTMGGDIEIDSIDGWVQAITMGGDIEVAVTGAGGDIELTSMSGDIELTVPSGFGMELDLEIAFTRNSGQEYRIQAPGNLSSKVSPEWDYDQGTPRKFIRMSGPVNGGGNRVKITTVNGNITVE